MCKLTIHIDDEKPGQYGFKTVIRFRADLELVDSSDEFPFVSVSYDAAYGNMPPDDRVGEIMVCVSHGVCRALGEANLGASSIEVANFLAHPVAFDTEHCSQLVESATKQALEMFDRK